MSASGDIALRLDGLGHRFDSGFRLDDINLEVSAGELVCVLGPSGCGKSTLLRLIAGLENVQHGAIWVSGQPVAGPGINLPPERRNVGLMFQDYALFPHMSVLQNVCFGLTRGDRDAEQQVRESLRDMGLAHLIERYPHTLSGGQQQRIALLRALAPRPGLMLLDEPFSGLDEHLRQQVREETRSTLERAGAASLIVTHDPEEAMYLAERMVVMDDGRIVQVDTPVNVYHHPVNPFIAGLFGPVNEWRGRVEGDAVWTPLGPIAAPGLPNGTSVQAVIRATGIRIHAVNGASALAEGTTLAQVITARPLGESTQILAAPQTHDATPLEIRLPGLQLLEAGTSVALEVNPNAAFVFRD